MKEHKAVELLKLNSVIYTIPTKRGIGVEIWGTYDDLSNLYEVIGKFWDYQSQDLPEFNGAENRDMLMSSFSYEIRKAKEQSRMKRTSNHFSFEQQEYFGTRISWVQMLFSLAALKYNMRLRETNKFDIAMILQIEFWLEKSMLSFDGDKAQRLVGFIEDGIYGANDCIYQCMRSVNLEFLRLGGGKKAFRLLPQLLQRAVYSTEEYKDYRDFLNADAKRLGCEPSELELNDDDFEYHKIKW